MSSSVKRRLMIGLGLIWAAPAVAAAQAPAYREDAGSALSRHVRTLAASPNDVTALKAAARAALELGDPQSALTFLGRAEAAAPRDGEVKAGMGSAFLQMEQPEAALKFFGEAAGLGAAEAGYAGDRGLARDLAGDTRRAQADYALALARGEDDEIRRRLALSLAIGGDKEKALAMLDPQLRRQDRAAWRARAFVLALSGDSAGATEAVRAVLPTQASAMQPFLARLPSLDPAQRAMAVHFGRFPGDGPPVQVAEADPARRYASVDPATIAAGKPDTDQIALGPRKPAPEPVSVAPRRRPGAAEAVAPGTGGQTLAPAVRVAAPPAKPVVLAKAGPPAATGDPRPTPARVVTAEPSAPFKVAEPRPPLVRPSRSALADMATMLAALNDPPATEAAPVQAARAEKAVPKPIVKPEKPSLKAADKAAPKKKAEPPPAKSASRVWVQIAGGANKSGLPKEFARQKDKAPKLLGARAAYTTPLRATNRLLVGPFKTDKEAQEFVNGLSKAGLSGFSWTSPAGQEIEKLPAK